MQTLTQPAALRAVPLVRRLLCLVYEALLLAALVLVASFPLAPLVQALPPPWGVYLQRLYVLVVAGAYLVWSWRHGGQTLAMKTWRIRLVRTDGAPVGLKQAWLRYALAVLGLLAGGLGFVWALWDRERQFLHDRLANTRLVEADERLNAARHATGR
ncbi:MAG: RDD family protein [Thiobacillaceae bacterium]|nr:RDD family protein [Thiobacillaceae bacterium]MDW8322561.1 RDD family protein [Burkholderiales bacterium]